MVLYENNALELKIGQVFFSNWQPQIEINGQIFKLNSHELTAESENKSILNCSLSEFSLKFKISWEERGNTVWIKAEIINHGHKSVKLGRFFLLNADISGLAQKGDQLVVQTLQPIRDIQKVYEINDPGLPESAQISIQFQNNTQNIALQVAFVSFQRANTELIIQRDSSDLRHLQAYCDFEQWELHAKQSTETEELRIVCGDNPYKQLESWADEVKDRLQTKIWEDAPLGYVGTAWGTGSESYEKRLLENLEAINKRLGGFGIKYLYISMRNFKGVPGNWLSWNDEKLPSGREKFIKAVQDKGFAPGFWIAPLYLCSWQKDLVEEFEDAILKAPNGEKLIVYKVWHHGDAVKIPRKDRPCIYALDPSHPKTIASIRKVFGTYKKWGVRYYMVDFLEAGAGNICSFPYKEIYDKSLVPGPEAYTNCLRIIKESAGEDTHLLTAMGPVRHSAGIADGVRVGSDFGEGRVISKGTFFYPASYLINDLGCWTGPIHALSSHASNYYTHRKLYLNNSGNVLTVDKPVPLSHAQINATIHAFSGGSTMLGDDIRQISEARLELIKKTLPRSYDCGRPLDLFTPAAPYHSTEFVRDIEQKWGSHKVLALYNFSSEAITKVVSFKNMGLDASKNHLLWDFWNEKFCGIHSGQLELVVAPESVRVLRIAEDNGQVQFLGTDMHLMMGEMELPEFRYNSETMVCSFRAERPLGERGMVFIYVPENICIKNIDDFHIAKDCQTGSVIVGVPLHFKQSFIEKQIGFDWIEQPVDMVIED